MLYYLSLLTHTDQLAFFRLFKYLTFRSGGAVITALLFSFRNFDTPVIVPVVPIALTKCVMRPSVSRQISGPVVS